eukprot:1157757-Pelagomonas_calceolata.AAC.4
MPRSQCGFKSMLRQKGPMYAVKPCLLQLGYTLLMPKLKTKHHIVHTCIPATRYVAMVARTGVPLAGSLVECALQVRARTVLVVKGGWSSQAKGLSVGLASSVQMRLILHFFPAR